MTNIFAKSHLSAILVAGAAIAFAAPVQAQDGRSQIRTPSSASATETPRAERQICVEMELTGSRIARRVCRTRAQWIAEEGEVPN
jgi:invasion protein IalB